MKKLFSALPLAAAICGISASAQAGDHYSKWGDYKGSSNKYGSSERYFQRISSFPVCENIDANCDTDQQTVAEIVMPSRNGRVLVYTDSQQERLGFVDISNPAKPLGIGAIDLTGEPTSVVVWRNYAIVGVNTSSGDVVPGSEDASADLKFERDMSGELAVYDMNSANLVGTLTLQGQPDSLAVSPDGRYLAVVIENERDEDRCVGGADNGGDDEDDCEAGGGEFGIPGQGPAGLLDIFRLKGKPDNWEQVAVDLTGLADKYPADPEPEYVDINHKNIAAVTLQENNHIVLVDLKSAEVIRHFSAGDVDLNQIDTEEEDPALISLSETENNIPREADGVAWLNNNLFATSDEGDLDGGSRGFTIYNTWGGVPYTSGNDLDHLTVSFGHYPDSRSGNKGNEPENVDYFKFGREKMLAIASERSSVLFIYDVENPWKPRFKQVLPAGVGPEGVKAIDSRKLLVAASEADERGDKYRSVINIYQWGYEAPTYPTLMSANRSDGTPIPWSAQSGLVAADNETLYSVQDSYYQQSRIFRIDISGWPAVIDKEVVLKDSGDVFSSLPLTTESDDSVFDQSDLADLINDDKTINVDPEGIAVASDGGFWVASEGSGTVGEAARPVVSANLIFKTDDEGSIEKVIMLPEAWNAEQVRFGFEGVAEQDGKLYVAIQRQWSGLGDPPGNTRIAVYDLGTDTWSYYLYPLDAAESRAGGWVGLSDVTALGNGKLLIIERDNQAGPDAAVKRLYRVDTTGLSEGDSLHKELVDDLMDDLRKPGGLVLEKIEGSAVLPNGDVLIINDNDGVEDHSGETQLLNLGKLLD